MAAGIEEEPSILEDLGIHRLPGWVMPAIVLFWVGYVLTLIVRPCGSARRARPAPRDLAVPRAGDRTGCQPPGAPGLAPGPGDGLDPARRARSCCSVFVGAIGTLVGTQVADLLSNSETYITDTVDFINDTFGTNDRRPGGDRRVQRPRRRASSSSSTASRTTPCALSVAALGVLLQVFSVLLFTYYLVADGPRLRRAICSRTAPGAPGAGALGVGAGDHQDRRLPVLAGLAGAAVGVLPLDRVPGDRASRRPIPLALWVGLISQFLPVVGTYIAGILPVLITFLDSPLKAAIVLGFIVVYQQIENYFFAPHITARTMELHPAVAFGAALGGAALLGPSARSSPSRRGDDAGVRDRVGEPPRGGRQRPHPDRSAAAAAPPAPPADLRRRQQT